MDLDAIEDGPIMPGFSGTLTPDEPLRTTREPAAAKPEPEGDEPEAEAAAVPETEPEVPEGDEPIMPAGGAAAPLELDDEAEIKIDGEVVKLKDLRQGRLAHSDYTRKTQELAREREAIEEERLDSRLADLQTEDFVTRMNDPHELINEFAAHKPEVWAKVVEEIVLREIKLADMTPDARELFLHKEAEARKAWKNAHEKRMQQAFEKTRGAAKARSEAAKNHSSWRTEAMKACGLSPTKDAHHEAVMDAMTSARNRGKPWTKELFDAEAARVAKILGVKAPKQPKAAKPAAPAAPAAPPKPALPPVRASGVSAAPRAGSAPAPRKANKPKDTGSFFDRLRSGELG